MTDYAAITDPANPFATKGLSREVRAVLDCLLAAKRAGLNVVATSTTDHADKTKAGYPSRHRMEGTDGLGLGVDCRMRGRGNGIHRAVFELFVPVERQLHELIYADPPSGKRADGTTAPYNIKAGRRVAPYAVSSHWDHVHLAISKGVFISLPKPSPKEALMRIPNAVGYCFLPNDDLVIADVEGALYFFDADGVPDEREYVTAYNANPEWWGGPSPRTHRSCIGVEARGDNVVEVFDDGATYEVAARL